MGYLDEIRNVYLEDIRLDIPNTDAGGCGIVALLISEQLKIRGIKHKFIMFTECSQSTFYRLNKKNGGSINMMDFKYVVGHIVVVVENHAIDTVNGVFSLNDMNVRWVSRYSTTIIKEQQVGDWHYDEPQAWNYMFDREDVTELSELIENKFNECNFKKAE